MANKKYPSLLIVSNILLYVLVSLFMYAFYKALSGFIANNFDDGLKMITIITSYLLPVIVYLYYVYSYFYKKSSKKVTLTFMIIFILMAIFNLVNIFIKLPIYISNNTMGVYDTMPSILNLFPYDMIVVNILILVASVLLIINTFKPIKALDDIIETYRLTNFFKFSVVEYIFISLLAILCFVFLGAFINSFNAIENALYDPKYIFLMLWVLVVPTSSLFFFVFKLENKTKEKKNKIIYLSSILLINVIFTSLLIIFEAIYPNYVTYIGKPIFAIAFSVSLPIEMLVILLISLITLIFASIYLIKTSLKSTNI